MCQYIFNHYVTFSNLLRHNMKFAHGWQLSKFVCFISHSETTFYILRLYKLIVFIYSIIYVCTFTKQHHAAEISFKNLYQNIYRKSQAAGWHMHANCRIPIRSCFLKSAFVGNVLLLEHFRHFSAHSISNRIFPILFLVFKIEEAAVLHHTVMRKACCL